MVKAFGRCVQTLRTERGWTLEVAAEKFGVEAAFVRRVEAARTNPSLAVIVSIATAFGLHPADLLRDPGDREETTSPHVA